MSDNSEFDSLLSVLRRRIATNDNMVGLPAPAYSSPELFKLEMSRIFGREWILVGRADELPNVGDRLTVVIAGEPIVIARGGDGELRALSGVCRHRYFPVTEPGFSSGRRLTCAYHRWSYGLDGRCMAAPLMDDVEGFDRSAVALPGLPLDQWEGFVFVSLDPDIGPLAPRLAPISAELGNHRLAEQRQTTRFDEEWPGNWKAAVENGSESYHHMGLHSQTVQPYMPAQGSEFVEGTEHFAGIEPRSRDSPNATGARWVISRPASPMPTGPTPASSPSSRRPCWRSWVIRSTRSPSYRSPPTAFRSSADSCSERGLSTLTNSSPWPRRS